MLHFHARVESSAPGTSITPRTMTEQFDDQLLEEFVQNFYGYGNYSGRHWFIGMEEGGGKSFSEVAKRLKAWADREKCELDDLAEYHTAIGKAEWFNDPPNLQ